ncbi:MAG TPA: c-type cytochrome [Terriglobales bacterium]|nr:c-type cytochrome [Terriglobales bacterium]
MKTTKLAALVAMIALVLFAALPNLSWAAEDGAALYKAKCAACHGADGAGKPAMKAPAVKGKTDADLQKANETSPKHAGVKSLGAEQVKAIGDYLKTLK